jgi:hypothetical protein
MKQIIGMMVVITAVCTLAFCEPKTITSHVESEKQIIKNMTQNQTFKREITTIMKHLVSKEV